jgi:hypothetical protein
VETSKWDEGSKKDKGVDKEAKRQEQLARKAEAARLLAEEEAGISPKKPTPNKAGGKKKVAKPAGPGAISTGGDLDSVDVEPTDDEPKEVESYSATGIDNALDLLEVVNAKTDKASVGQQAADIERHPEVSVDVCGRAQPSGTHVLPTSAAKVQGENRFMYSMASRVTRFTHASWSVLVHKLGRLGSLQGTGVT